MWMILLADATRFFCSFFHVHPAASYRDSGTRPASTNSLNNSREARAISPCRCACQVSGNVHKAGAARLDQEEMAKRLVIDRITDHSLRVGRDTHTQGGRY